MEKIGACVLEALDALASKRKIAFAQIKSIAYTLTGRHQNPGGGGDNPPKLNYVITVKISMSDICPLAWRPRSCRLPAGERRP